MNEEMELSVDVGEVLNADAELVVRGSGGIRNSIRNRQLSLFKKQPKRSTVELVQRDLKVIEFILDMKFAGYSEVFEKFFSTTHAGNKTESKEWARKRLRQLENAGFLISAVSITGGPQVYCAAFKGYYTLKNLNPERTFPRPTATLDTRTFIHDKEVLLARLKIERAWGDIQWMSDRKLRQGFGEPFGLSGIHVPDAVFMQPELGWVAFELEIAIKTKDRYADKVARYVRLIRESRMKTLGIRNVTYRCLRSAVFEALAKECRPYGDMFSVELCDSLSNRELGVSV